MKHWQVYIDIINSEEKLPFSEEGLSLIGGLDNKAKFKAWKTVEIDARTEEEALQQLESSEYFDKNNETIREVIDITKEYTQRLVGEEEAAIAEANTRDSENL
jgi:hypothetical protein